MLSAKRGCGTMAERVQYLAVSECYLGREGVDSAYREGAVPCRYRDDATYVTGKRGRERERDCVVRG